MKWMWVCVGAILITSCGRHQNLGSFSIVTGYDAAADGDPLACQIRAPGEGLRTESQVLMSRVIWHRAVSKIPKDDAVLIPNLELGVKVVAAEERQIGKTIVKEFTIKVPGGSGVLFDAVVAAYSDHHVELAAGVNGEYEIGKILWKKRPNKAPEPTPGPVTPHASSGELK